MGAEWITKILTNSKTWKSLSRCELSLTELPQNLVPKYASSASSIFAEYLNGTSAQFIIFKDEFGKMVKSYSFFPNGTKTVISRSFADKCLSGSSKAKELYRKGFYPTQDIFTKEEYSNGVLNKIQKTFSEVWKKYGRKENTDEIYQTVIRTSKQPQTNGTANFSQEVLQLETGQFPSRISVKSTSEMAHDGELTLQSVEQNGVSMDTSNPYFQALLMEPHDMLRAGYADIVKRRGMKGIEPPLLFNDTSNIYNGIKGTQSAGSAAFDNKYIGINLARQENADLCTKADHVFTLGHECEHAFTQHANIHLAGIEDLRSDNPASQRFFDGITQRFKPVKKGTKEYNDALIYKQEGDNYHKIYDENGVMNAELHDTMKCEKDADIEGIKEKTLFLECLSDFIKNFPLFNSKYALSI